MRRLPLTFALILLLSPISNARVVRPGLGRIARGEHTIYGMIDSVQGQVLTLSNYKKKQNQVRDQKITLDGNTKITVNGQPADSSVLTSGVSVIVTMKHHVAQQIQVTTKK